MRACAETLAAEGWARVTLRGGSQSHETPWEEGRREYNLPERPKKFKDHLMDCTKYYALMRGSNVITPEVGRVSIPIDGLNMNESRFDPDYI